MINIVELTSENNKLIPADFQYEIRILIETTENRLKSIYRKNTENSTKNEILNTKELKKI